ncbi:LysR family transcriptional regulator [Neptunomonas antarctica]|uniref:Transcriptional regulator, LysR family n=1 Tax=Neptunomonas antarctica TaxID=619304 RepID=A0A1N7NWA7_9GAMM|nr:LysR family transcriptional regulator [Neptunomonas antarctica]SIT02600.1 transcriptional regulator, LysR family [Neptunomonas antarctica]
MDRLTAMRVFKDVAHTRSFTASAERLDMSRAMVTRYIATMEKWLGARLLQRTTRLVTLTHAGEQSLEHCLKMLEIMQDAESEITPADNTLRGQLRLTCSMSFAHAHLSTAICDFLALHPHLKIDINADDHTLNLIEARIDLAIRISNEPDPMLIARPLATCDSILVASPGYITAHGRPRHPTDLNQHQCLGYANFGQGLWQLTRADQQEQIKITPRFTANEVTVLLNAALAGAGIALQPTYLANEHIEKGALLQVLPEWLPPTLTLYALYTSRRHLSPAVRALLDFLVERFATAPW